MIYPIHPFSLANCVQEFQNIPQMLTNLIKRIFQAPAGYFLKISVFRSAAMQDRFSKWFVEPVMLAVLNLWQKVNGIPLQHAPLDLERLERGAAFLREFAEVRTVRTPDGKEIRWTCYRPEKFEEWIRAHGGVRIGEWVFGEGLKRLGEFKWFEQRGNAFRIPARVQGASQVCVLRCQGFGRAMTMDKNAIGHHLAAGFNYATFDWREDLSIKGFFQDAESVYQAILREGFRPHQIKVMGSCRATFPVAYLKEKHHREGLDAVLIHPPTSLREIVANQMCPANWIGLMGLGAIETDGEDFDSLRRLRRLQSSLGRLCLLVSEGDKTLPADTVQRFRDAAGDAGPFHVITEPKTESGGDPHFEEPLRQPAIFKHYTNFLVGAP